MLDETINKCKTNDNKLKFCKYEGNFVDYFKKKILELFIIKMEISIKKNL